MARCGAIGCGADRLRDGPANAVGEFPAAEFVSQMTGVAIATASNDRGSTVVALCAAKAVQVHGRAEKD